MRPPIIAYRGWQLILTSEGWRLRSLVMPCIWSGPVFRSGVPRFNLDLDTLRRERPLPDIGIFSMAQPLTGSDLACYAPLLIDAHVSGAVELGGVIIRHFYGYRSQIATVREMRLILHPVRLQMEGTTEGALLRPLSSEVRLSDIRNDLESTYHCECAL